MKSLEFKPIGYFHNSLDNPNEAPRQPNKDLPGTAGTIKLESGLSLEDGLRDLDGFSQIWVLFHFHKNDTWNPMVMPPRGSDVKRGVFATRSPYRPNPIGMSVLDLIKIDGLTLTLGATDLLNGTPILDIKPYIPYIDSHPDAKIGWLDSTTDQRYSVVWSPSALEQIAFLEAQGLTQLSGFVLNQLEYEPTDKKKKRLYFLEDRTLLAYRTWRVEFKVTEPEKRVEIVAISSGYTSDEFQSEIDTYEDKKLHLFFTKSFNPQKDS